MVSASGRFSQFQDKAMENRSLDLRKMDGAVQDGNKRLSLQHKNNNLWKKRLNSKSSTQKMQMIF